MKSILTAVMAASFLFAANAFAQQGSEFYFKNSYGRGVGTIPRLDCPADKEGVASLCYEPCKDGTKAEGTHCEDKGKGNKKDYERFGRGTAKHQVCDGNKENDAGLCYQQCRQGYDGVGPVCWSKTPPGYKACGSGFAMNDSTCGMVTADMTLAAGFLAASMAEAASPSQGKAASGAKAAKGVAKLGEKAVAAIVKDGPLVFEVAWFLTGQLKGPIEDIMRKQQSGSLSPQDLANVGAKINAAWEEAKRAKAGKAWNAFESAFLLKAQGSAAQQNMDAFAMIRNMTGFISIALSITYAALPAPIPAVDLLGSGLGIIAAYTWPIYGQ